MRNPKAMFMDGYGIAATGMKREVIQEWQKEKELTNCQTCGETSCPARGDSDRFNTDAGGRCQCLRLAKHISRYAFRNVDGTVIIIPDEIMAGGAQDGETC